MLIKLVTRTAVKQYGFGKSNYKLNESLEPGITPMKESKELGDRMERFLLAECDYLRKEIEAMGAEIRALQRYAIVATGVIWTWLATHKMSSSIFAWIPAL